MTITRPKGSKSRDSPPNESRGISPCKNMDIYDLVAYRIFSEIGLWQWYEKPGYRVPLSVRRSWGWEPRWIELFFVYGYTAKVSDPSRLDRFMQPSKTVVGRFPTPTGSRWSDLETRFIDSKKISVVLRNQRQMLIYYQSRLINSRSRYNSSSTSKASRSS
jgi:hypothetical protein